MASALSNLAQVRAKNSIDALDRQMEAELEARGLLEESEEEKLTKEIAAAEKAGDAQTANEKKRSLERLKVEEKFAKKKNTKQFRESHIHWHEIFINACGNEVLISLLKRLRMHYLWHRFAYQYYQEDFAKTVSYHKKILALFKNKKSNPEDIERLVRDHIAVALDRFFRYLKG